MTPSAVISGVVSPSRSDPRLHGYNQDRVAKATRFFYANHRLGDG
jgi:hypothetical protein